MTAEVWVHRLLEDMEGLGPRSGGVPDVLPDRVIRVQHAGDGRLIGVFALAAKAWA